MRALPVTVPKLMVSTLASGDTSPYVSNTNITMMPSIVDVSGLNSISRQVLFMRPARYVAWRRLRWSNMGTKNL